jgi:4-amino-4-deoxy-L-arabinose transferase-like glycosyltransferase
MSGSMNRSRYVVAVSLFMAFHAWALLRYPPPFVDEAWFANRAWSLLTTGDPMGSLDSGVVDQSTHGSYFFPLLPLLPYTFAFWIGGSPSLLSVRLVSLLTGFILCWAVWRMVGFSHTGNAGPLAALLLGLSPSFMYSAHLGRPDILAAATAYSGLALVSARLTVRQWRFAVGGLLVGLATEFHPFAAAVVPALPCLLVVRFGWRGYTQRPTQLAMAGLILGLSVYPFIHVAPSPRSYFALSRVIYGPTHTPQLGEVLGGFGDTWQLLNEGFYSAPLLVAAAAAFLVTSRNMKDRQILLVAAVVVACFSILVRNKLNYYAILVTPALAMVLAVGYNSARRQIRSQIVLRCGITGSVVLLAAGCFQSAQMLAIDATAAYEAAARPLPELIGPPRRLIGSQTYWFSLHDRTYNSWEQIVYLRRLCPTFDVAGALALLRPEFLIVDAHFEWYITDDPSKDVYAIQLRVPKTELEQWLAKTAEIVADYAAPFYGRIRVYRVHGDRLGTPPTCEALAQLR